MNVESLIGLHDSAAINTYAAAATPVQRLWDNEVYQ